MAGRHTARAGAANDPRLERHPPRFARYRRTDAGDIARDAAVLRQGPARHSGAVLRQGPAVRPLLRHLQGRRDAGGDPPAAAALGPDRRGRFQPALSQLGRALLRIQPARRRRAAMVCRLPPDVHRRPADEGGRNRGRGAALRTGRTGRRARQADVDAERHRQGRDAGHRKRGRGLFRLQPPDPQGRHCRCQRALPRHHQLAVDGIGRTGKHRARAERQRRQYHAACHRGRQCLRRRLQQRAVGGLGDGRTCRLGARDFGAGAAIQPHRR